MRANCEECGQVRNISQLTAVRLSKDSMKVICTDHLLEASPAIAETLSSFDSPESSQFKDPVHKRPQGDALEGEE